MFRESGNLPRIENPCDIIHFDQTKSGNLPRIENPCDIIQRISVDLGTMLDPHSFIMLIFVTSFDSYFLLLI
jgi:hypothetical protein